MKQALLYTRLRHIALRAGEILCQQGWLTTREDVFYLTIDELMDLLTGASHTPDASAGIAAARREAMIGHSSEVAPHHLVLAGGAHWQPTPAGHPDYRDSETTLVGTTACGGAAEGSAAVVLDVTEAARLQAGDILEPISKLLAAVDTLYRWNDSVHGRTVGTHSGSFSGGAHCRWSSWTQTNPDAARA